MVVATNDGSHEMSVAQYCVESMDSERREEGHECNFPIPTGPATGVVAIKLMLGKLEEPPPCGGLQGPRSVFSPPHLCRLDVFTDFNFVPSSPPSR
jgi:hypothetical protein